MRRLVNSIPYLNKRIGTRKTTGQGLVEFALISFLLFFLIMGILEMGRMLFILTQVSDAAQEGARYGAIHPHEIIGSQDPSDPSYPPGSVNADPCNIISQARARVILIDPHDVDITVAFDSGVITNVVHPYGPACPGGGCLSDPLDFAPLSNRVVVAATYTFHFVTPLLDVFAPQGLALQMVSARTILTNEQFHPPVSPPAPASCSDDPPPIPAP